MRLGISRPFAVGVVAAIVVLTLLADVAKDSSQSAEIDDLRSQLEDVRMQLNRTGQRDLAMWDATVAVEERIRLKVKDAMELEYGLAKQGELMVKLAHEVKKLKTAAVPARDRRSMARTFKHIGTTGMLYVCVCVWWWWGGTEALRLSSHRRLTKVSVPTSPPPSSRAPQATVLRLQPTAAL